MGNTAVVTGASAGIGAQFARRLSDCGYDLVLVARRAERLEALAASVAMEAEPLVADLASPDDLARVASRVAQDDVTMLVNNAGINGYGPFVDADPAVLSGVLALNVTAPTLLARAALPGMLARGGGAIVNVASLLAFAGSLPPDPMPWRSTYAATKGYMVTFSRTLAAELGPESPVQVQVLCPGYTATEFHMTNTTDPVTEAPPDEPHAMSAAEVVQASLVALDAGEVVCVPGLEDPVAIEQLADAEAAVRAGARKRAAARYR